MNIGLQQIIQAINVFLEEKSSILEEKETLNALTQKNMTKNNF